MHIVDKINFRTNKWLIFLRGSWFRRHTYLRWIRSLLLRNWGNKIHWRELDAGNILEIAW